MNTIMNSVKIFNIYYVENPRNLKMCEDPYDHGRLLDVFKTIAIRKSYSRILETKSLDG